MSIMRLPLFKKLLLAFVFLWFIIGGVTHFARPDLFLLIILPILPWPLALVYISGFFELAGAVGLLFNAGRRWAGNGLILLTICVTPANIYMWQHADLFPSVPPILLGLRLVFQLLLIAGIWWATRPDPVLMPERHACTMPKR